MTKPSGGRGGRKPGVSANVLLTVGVVVVAIAVIGGIVLFGGSDDPDQSGSGDALAPAGSHAIMEASEGGVTVVEFLDFQCPACAGYYANVTRQLERDYDGKITFVARNFPLDSHPLAVPAAQAAEAASRQGKYAQMYHALYDNYGSWAVAPDGKNLSDDATRARKQFDAFARDVGLDLTRFQKDMESAAVTKRIEADQSAGTEAGVDSTPTIFVNGTKFSPTGKTFGEVSQELRETIDKALGE